MDQDSGGQEAQGQGRFAIHRVYLKDVSLETPNSPAIFRDPWKPDVSMNLSSETKSLETDTYEVVLSVTVTVKLGERTAYLVEVQQAGIFGAQGFGPHELNRLLGSYCPNLLFPFAREAVSDLVMKGGFPQLLLAPVNFDALYAQHLQRAQEQRQGDGSDH